MRMKRKAFIIFITCLVSVSLLAGCGGKKKESGLSDMLEKAGDKVTEEKDSNKEDKPEKKKRRKEKKRKM